MPATDESNLYRDKWLNKHVHGRGLSSAHIEKGTLYRLSNDRVINIKFRKERKKEWYWAAIFLSYLERADFFVFLLDSDETFYVIPREDLRIILNNKPWSTRRVNFNISPSRDKLLCGSEYDIRKYRGRADVI